MKLDIKPRIKKPINLSHTQQTYVEKSPISCQGILRDAFNKTAPKSRAIKAKCLDCCCFDRDEVKNCKAELCPLWHYRPYTTRKKADDGRMG